MSDVLKEKIVEYLNSSTEDKLERYLSFIKNCNLTKEEKQKRNQKKYQQSQKGIEASRRANRKYYKKMRKKYYKKILQKN